MLTFNYGNSKALMERVTFQVICGIRKMGIVDMPTISRWLATYRQDSYGVLGEVINTLKEVRNRRS